MKKHFLPLAFGLLLSYPSFAQTVASTSSTQAETLLEIGTLRGINGANIGDPLSSIPGLVPSKSQADRYTRPSDKLSFNGFSVRKIEYIFENGKLKKISMKYGGVEQNGFEMNEAAKTMLVKTYGPSYADLQNGTFLVWKGKFNKVQFLPATEDLRVGVIDIVSAR